MAQFLVSCGNKGDLFLSELVVDVEGPQSTSSEDSDVSDDVTLPQSADDEDDEEEG